MSQETNIRQLVINKLTDAQYEQAVKNADELYLTPDDGSGGGTDLPDQTGQSGKFLTTNGSTLSWGSVPAGTVTSVRVQAGTGLSSSQSTAQSSVLNTTISIASGYKLPTTTEWSNKQDALPSQTGQSGKYLTTNGTTMSWAEVQGGGDSLPDQTGQEGKFLTTNGSTASWADVQDSLDLEEMILEEVIPDQSGQSGKFLTTNGITTAWATVQGGGSGYVPMPTVTNLTNTTYTLSVAENTIYEFTNAITSLTISSVVKSYLESFIYFTTGSSITFVDNSTLKWGGGSIPSLETNTTYCIAIKNGLAEIDKFGR